MEYVDYSIDWMERNQVESSDLSLVTELADIRRREIMHVPEWGDKVLDDAVAVGNKDAEKALALFTLQK